MHLTHEKAIYLWKKSSFVDEQIYENNAVFCRIKLMYHPIITQRKISYYYMNASNQKNV